MTTKNVSKKYQTFKLCFTKIILIMITLRSHNWRYRCLSMTLFTAAFFSFMLINAKHSINLTYQEDDETTSTSYARQRNKHIKSVIAYSLERQLQMEKNEVQFCSKYLKSPDQSELNIRNRYWQQPDNGIYFYSAYVDNRIKQHHFIRVLGMISEDWKPIDLFCQFSFDKKTMAVVGHIVDIWLPHWDTSARKNTSKPVILSCEIPLGQIPQGVSINSDVCSIASTYFRFEDSIDTMKNPKSKLINIKRFKKKRQFAVCVKGMDYSKDISSRLIEWIELNILLGTDIFFMYIYAIHKNVRQVLEYYEDKGLVQIINMTLPPPQPNEPSTRSIFLSKELWQKRRNEIIPYNDCYYRNLYSSRFVIPIDIDEVILPVKHRTWGEIIQELEKNNSSVLENFSSFSVRNAYFLGTYPKDNTEDLHMLSYVRRSEFSPGEDNVKSFISTTNALAVFNHFTLRTLSTDVRRNVILDTGLVQMNHYRGDCDTRLVEDCDRIKRKYKRDMVILKYKDELINRVRSAREGIMLHKP